MARRRVPTSLMLLSALMCGLLLSVVQRSSGREIRISPRSSSFERVMLHLDRAEGYLDVLVEELDEERPWLAETALKIYTRQISKLHLDLGRSPIHKQDKGIGVQIVQALKAHQARLQAIDEIGHPELNVALKEAVNHVSSAVAMLEEKLEHKKKRFKISFPGPRDPDPVTGRASDSVTGRFRRKK